MELRGSDGWVPKDAVDMAHLQAGGDPDELVWEEAVLTFGDMKLSYHDAERLYHMLGMVVGDDPSGMTRLHHLALMSLPEASADFPGGYEWNIPAYAIDDSEEAA